MARPTPRAGSRCFGCFAQHANDAPIASRRLTSVPRSHGIGGVSGDTHPELPLVAKDAFGRLTLTGRGRSEDLAPHFPCSLLPGLEVHVVDFSLWIDWGRFTIRIETSSPDAISVAARRQLEAAGYAVTADQGSWRARKDHGPTGLDTEELVVTSGKDALMLEWVVPDVRILPSFSRTDT